MCAILKTSIIHWSIAVSGCAKGQEKSATTLGCRHEAAKTRPTDGFPDYTGLRGSQPALGLYEVSMPSSGSYSEHD